MKKRHTYHNIRNGYNFHESYLQLEPLLFHYTYVREIWRGEN